jgi:hypothetical protein
MHNNLNFVFLPMGVLFAQRVGVGLVGTLRQRLLAYFFEAQSSGWGRNLQQPSPRARTLTPSSLRLPQSSPATRNYRGIVRFWKVCRLSFLLIAFRDRTPMIL